MVENILIDGRKGLTMAKLLGPDFISLQVRDFAKSRAFYTELLGFPVDPRFDTADFVLLCRSAASSF